MRDFIDLIIIVGLGIYGVYSIFMGLANKFGDKQYLGIFIRMALSWLRRTKGDEAADQQKERFLAEENISMISTNYLLVGAASFVVSIFMLLQRFF